MIEESGQVTSVEPPYATVATQRRSSCSSCSSKGGCGTGSLSQMFAARTQEMRVLNPIDAKVGEQVVLGLEEGALLRSSLTVYIVPLLLMIVGGLFGEWMAPALSMENSSEYLSIPAALFGLVAGFGWVRLISRRMAQDDRYTAVILRRTGPSNISPILWRSH